MSKGLQARLIALPVCDLDRIINMDSVDIHPDNTYTLGAVISLGYTVQKPIGNCVAVRYLLEEKY